MWICVYVCLCLLFPVRMTVYTTRDKRIKVHKCNWMGEKKKTTRQYTTLSSLLLFWLSVSHNPLFAKDPNTRSSSRDHHLLSISHSLLNLLTFSQENNHNTKKIQFYRSLRKVEEHEDFFYVFRIVILWSFATDTTTTVVCTTQM